MFLVFLLFLRLLVVVSLISWCVGSPSSAEVLGLVGSFASGIGDIEEVFKWAWFSPFFRYGPVAGVLVGAVRNVVTYFCLLRFVHETSPADGLYFIVGFFGIGMCRLSLRWWLPAGCDRLGGGCA